MVYNKSLPVESYVSYFFCVCESVAVSAAASKLQGQALLLLLTKQG